MTTLDDLSREAGWYDRHMASREEVKAYKKFCEKAVTEQLSPAEVIQLATRGLIIADALTAAEEERDRLLEALRGIENTPPANIKNQIDVPNGWWERLVTDMRNQARAALQETGDG